MSHECERMQTKNIFMDAGYVAIGEDFCGGEITSIDCKIKRSDTTYARHKESYKSQLNFMPYERSDTELWCKHGWCLSYLNSM